MNTIENKVFKNLLHSATFEIHGIGEVEIFHLEEEDFSFTYDFHNDTLEQKGELTLTGEQVEELCELAYDFHKEYELNQGNDDAFEYMVDHYHETGTHPGMFI